MQVHFNVSTLLAWYVRTFSLHSQLERFKSSVRTELKKISLIFFALTNLTLNSSVTDGLLDDLCTVTR